MGKGRIDFRQGKRRCAHERAASGFLLLCQKSYGCSKNPASCCHHMAIKCPSHLHYNNYSPQCCLSKFWNHVDNTPQVIQSTGLSTLKPQDGSWEKDAHETRFNSQPDSIHDGSELSKLSNRASWATGAGSPPAF